MKLANERLSLAIDLGDRIVPRRLEDRRRTIAYADAPYAYTLAVECDGKACRSDSLRYERHEQGVDGGVREVRFEGRLDFGPEGPKDIGVRQVFRIPTKGAWLEERISICNRGSRPYRVRDVAFGFRKVIYHRDAARWADGFEDFVLTPVPHRRRFGHRTDRKLAGYALADLLPHMWENVTAGPSEPHDRNLPDHGAEGWVWSDGASGLLVLKYQPDRIEFSMFKGEITPPDFCARFGGAGLWRGDPEHARELPPGEWVEFGLTRYEIVDGGWKEGYYAFRSFLASRGSKLPADFDPPVHWNEIYNLSWRLGDGSTRFTLEQLYREAGIAADIGCEALYLDPGWDTVEGSTIWDEKHLGITLKDFVRTVRDRYGLKVSLHLMMNTNSRDEYPGMYRRDEQGRVVAIWNGAKVCTQSAWKQEKTRRLLALARDGVSFFMFDFLAAHPPCHDPAHGHEVPLTRQGHAEGLIEVMRNVKKEFPGILIEAHDRIGSGYQDYHPLYYQYDPSSTFDENWGFEYMWDSYLDLISGKAISLYEYNLACEIPLYLHINIGQRSGLLDQGSSVGPDNRNLLAFWWYASTVRHLGIGGVSEPRSALYKALKRAMKTYRSLAAFYKRGTFYGIDEMTHVHTIASRNQAVINVFNLGGRTVTRDIRVNLREIGLEKLSGVRGAPVVRRTKGGFTFRCELKPLSSALVKVNLPAGRSRAG